MSNGRARKGGEIGVNGEFYEGGTFLPSTDLPKRPASKSGKPTGAKKEQIAPYRWEVAPADGMRSIFTALSGTVCKYVNGKLMVNASDEALAYTRRTRAQVAALAERYNNGEMWARQDEVYG